jgi:hypothetical protein
VPRNALASVGLLWIALAPQALAGNWTLALRALSCGLAKGGESLPQGSLGDLTRSLHACVAAHEAHGPASLPVPALLLHLAVEMSSAGHGAKELVALLLPPPLQEPFKNSCASLLGSSLAAVLSALKKQAASGGQEPCWWDAVATAARSPSSCNALVTAAPAGAAAWALWLHRSGALALQLCHEQNHRLLDEQAPGSGAVSSTHFRSLAAAGALVSSGVVVAETGELVVLSRLWELASAAQQATGAALAALAVQAEACAFARAPSDLAPALLAAIAVPLSGLLSRQALLLATICSPAPDAEQTPSLPWAEVLIELRWLRKASVALSAALLEPSPRWSKSWAAPPQPSATSST